MIVRLGLLVAASIAAYKFQQNVNGSKLEHGEVRNRKHQDEGTEEKQSTCSTNCVNQKEREEEEQEEEVKLISGILNQANDFDDEILSEFESLLSEQIDFPLLADKTNEAKKDGDNETETEKTGCELERLRNVVDELEEREVKLESELLEYYGLKEQVPDIEELQRQLRIKTVEIDMLHMTIKSLEEENTKLQTELTCGASANRELEAARNKIEELQRQIRIAANQTKGQLLLLKQKVSGLQRKEEEAAKKDAEVEKKLKTLNDLEVEVVELKRRNKELQHEKRELTVKLNAAESRIAEHCSMAENEIVAKANTEVGRLRHANEDLQKQVEGLQMNRFSEVEELVYLRWVNACLRYELRNYKAPSGKSLARDLNNSFNPKSQEKAKQLMLEYAVSERGQCDTDLESNFSHDHSSPGSEDLDNAYINSPTYKYSNLSKKTTLIQKLKKWNKNKDDSSAYSSPAIPLSIGSPCRVSTSYRPRNTLESLMLRNAHDAVAITTFGQKEHGTTHSPETPSLPSLRKVSPSDDILDSASASFQLMSKSVDRSMDEKYPAYKDLHKLALAREKQLKDKAEKARGKKFGDISNLDETEAEQERSISLQPKLTQVNETDQSEDGKSFDHQTISKMKLFEINKRPPRVPRPPPNPTDGASVSNSSNGIPYVPSVPPPPPPPPISLPRGSVVDDQVKRAPELVEFYQQLMKREAKKDTSSLTSSTSNLADARSNMIGEIENRSTFLLAVKADVETQGDFVLSLATEVRAASFSKIEDVVAFVNWLDEELSFLVDERAVLKHFNWPEGKSDALREASFEYQDLMKLGKQVSTFIDDPKLPCDVALQNMYSLLEKVEQSVYALLRTRDFAISRYKEFGLPVNWLLDSGVVGKIKLSSVQLANMYMKRIASELDILSGPENEPTREFLILQGVRFAFRVHQFAGGFDTESMKAFEELRNRIHDQASEHNNKPETATEGDQ
ncbi:protein CHUP1, chloroplastic-like isoform X2 [Trifolium pratense]|uniref:protein CHUP1, chloroplastic-like isoform X2 n=1 Tax=Trifolium pratense TaxID=57577 RepID=UPI001E696A21|nr:protein CHUP1, chloroplastic-like isoform X2 [Trifolium pratense]